MGKGQGGSNNSEGRGLTHRKVRPFELVADPRFKHKKVCVLWGGGGVPLQKNCVQVQGGKRPAGARVPLVRKTRRNRGHVRERKKKQEKPLNGGYRGGGKGVFHKAVSAGEKKGLARGPWVGHPRGKKRASNLLWLEKSPPPTQKIRKKNQRRPPQSVRSEGGGGGALDTSI